MTEVIGIIFSGAAAIFAALGWLNSRPRLDAHAEVIGARRKQIKRSKKHGLPRPEKPRKKYKVMIEFRVELIARRYSYRIEDAEYFELNEKGEKVTPVKLKTLVKGGQKPLPKVIHPNNHWKARITREYRGRPHQGRVSIKTDKGWKTISLDLGTAYDSVEVLNSV